MLNIKGIIRKLFKRKLYTSFTLISFTIAFCCSILAYLFVSDELAFDKYNTNFEHVYRLNNKAKDKSYVDCSFPGIFHENLSSVAGVARYARLATSSRERNISINQKTFIETSFLYGDPEILEILDFEFLAGNPNEALGKPLSVIITKSMSEKYFGQDIPLGKTISMDKHDYTITGVVKDLPAQSHLKMNFLASASSYKTINNRLLSNWYVTAFSYYFLLPENTKPREIESQLTDIYANGRGIDDSERKFDMYLESLGDIHLKSVDTRWDDAIKGDIKVVYGLIGIVLLILGIAITNYINNLTAEFRKKVKEIGIKKFNGASKTALAMEQGFETFVLLSVSMILAVLFTYILLPYTNDLVEKTLEINFSVFVVSIILVILSTQLSIIYPILFFNSFNASDAIKNQFSLSKSKKGKNQQTIRGSVITFQLGITTLLIVSTLVISNQLQLVLESKTGFDKDNTLIVKNPYGEEMNNRYDLFKEELLKIASVKSVGVTQNTPGSNINNYSPLRLPEQEENFKTNIGQISVDHDFLDAIGAKFISGRNFNRNISTDQKTGIVINKSASEIYNLKDPVGSKLSVLYNAFSPNNELEIIGVIEDMQYFTLRENAKPVMYFIRGWGRNNIVINLDKGDYLATIDKIKQSWKEVAPNLPFNSQLMNDRLISNYKSEINTAKIVSLLSAIAIILSLLGVFGMILFTTKNKTKEIGIRKVNGATISEIMFMLNKGFIKWVVLSFIIATPIAWYAMNKWLENFAYKTELSWWIFALAGVITLLIALLTVSWQTFKAARRNPVEALRYE